MVCLCPLLDGVQAGKDRTGIIAALVLKCAGASDLQVVNDYARCVSKGVALYLVHLSSPAVHLCCMNESEPGSEHFLQKKENDITSLCLCCKKEK